MVNPRQHKIHFKCDIPIVFYE